MTADTERPIVQYWHGEKIPDQVAELQATFRERNPDMPHLVFSERAAEELIADSFGARHVKAFQACAVPAMQADYFRYCAVHALGGVYADANFASIRPLRPCLSTGGRLFEQPPHGPVLNGLFAFSSPGHPLLAMTIEIATRNIENRLCESVALTTGPAIFTGLLQLQRGGSLEALRESAAHRWSSQLDSCWDSLVDSFNQAIDSHGPVADAFEGVCISTRAEMLSWVQKPRLEYQNPDGHWAHRQGTIFRPQRSQVSP